MPTSRTWSVPANHATFCTNLAFRSRPVFVGKEKVAWLERRPDRAVVALQLRFAGAPAQMVEELIAERVVSVVEHGHRIHARNATA